MASGIRAGRKARPRGRKRNAHTPRRTGDTRGAVRTKLGRGGTRQEGELIFQLESKRLTARGPHGGLTARGDSVTAREPWAPGLGTDGPCALGTDGT